MTAAAIQEAIARARRALKRQADPSMRDMANAVGEMHELQVGLLAQLKDKAWIGVDPDQIRDVEWRVSCLAAAYLELRERAE
jgi:hypothetical protein